MCDTGFNLSPPKRRSTRPRKKKKYTSTEDEDTEIDGTVSSPEGSQAKGKAPVKKTKPQGKTKGRKPKVCHTI